MAFLVLFPHPPTPFYSHYLSISDGLPSAQQTPLTVLCVVVCTVFSPVQRSVLKLVNCSVRYYTVPLSAMYCRPAVLTFSCSSVLTYLYLLTHISQFI